MLIAWLATGMTAYLLYYFIRAVNKPRLVHADTAFARRVIAACPGLSEAYRPPIWGFNCHIQIVHMLLRQRLIQRRSRFELTETITAADGGSLSIDWFGRASHRPGQAILLMLPTISGSAQDLWHHVTYLHERMGWTVAVCNRRGHGELRLSSPKFNILGCLDDLELQMDAIERRYPGSPLYAYGLSAGTALLVRYLGRRGEASRIVAAVANSPGYDTEIAFQRMPAPYNFVVTRKLQAHFLQKNAAVLAHKAAYQSCLEARNMDDFHSRMHELAGYASHQDFIADTNPMLSAATVSVPLLVLNAEDDPVCVARNAYDHLHLIQQLPRCILAITRHGSHCAFWEGWLGRHSWSDRIAVQFFQAVHRSCYNEGDRPRSSEGMHDGKSQNHQNQGASQSEEKEG